MMKSLASMMAIGLLTVTALAGPGILPTRALKGTRYAAYELATGRLRPLEDLSRAGTSVWAATQRSGQFFIQMHLGPGTTSLDWGDIAGPQDIGAFAFSYGVDSPVQPPQQLDVVVMFFAEENGRNSTGRMPLAAFAIPNLPAGSDPPGEAWTILVELEPDVSAFTIAGSDLDGDALVDFGYSYWFTNYSPSGPENYVGPVVAGDPNVIPPTAPGMEDLFDLFADPNLNEYLDTYWFGGVPFAQFYLELFDVTALYCPEPGARGWHCIADIAPWPEHDCVVDLSDLAQLLANYRRCAPCAHEQGDVEPEDRNGIWDPWDGDGDVDLSDLAQMLSMYRDDCN